MHTSSVQCRRVIIHLHMCRNKIWFLNVVKRISINKNMSWQKMVFDFAHMRPERDWFLWKRNSSNRTKWFNLQLNIIVFIHMLDMKLMVETHKLCCWRPWIWLMIDIFDRYSFLPHSQEWHIVKILSGGFYFVSKQWHLARKALQSLYWLQKRFACVQGAT